MLQLFRNNTPYAVLILLILLLLTRLPSLSGAAIPSATDGQLLYQLVVLLCRDGLRMSGFGFGLLSVFLAMIQALYLYQVALRHRLFIRPGYLPAFSYVLLTAIHVALSRFSPPLVANCALVAALDFCLGMNQTSQPRKHLFNAGFAFSLAFLCDAQAVLYVVLLYASLLLHRTFNAGEWTVASLGLITPVYFALGVLFLVDEWGRAKWSGSYYPLSFASGGSPVNASILLGGLVFLFVTGVAQVRAAMNKATINVRRAWVHVLFYLIISVLVAIASGNRQNQWMLSLPPLSLFIAAAFQHEKYKRLSSFTFYFSLLWVVLCQLSINK